MSKRETVNDTEKEKGRKSGTGGNGRILICFRWLFLAFLIVLPFFTPENTGMSFSVLQSSAVAIVYNIIVTAHTLERSRNCKKTSVSVFYFDAALVSFYVFLTGGLNSDAYIFLFFLIGYCGMLNDYSNTIKIGIFSIAAYTISCMFSARVDLQEINYLRLAIKDLMLALCTVGVSYVYFEVKKYDEMHKKEFLLARTDKLTGLANRHYFDQKVREEIEYSNYTGNPLNILMFDLDNFKGFNDTYGHTLGDKLLVLFSDIIKQNIRKTDIPVRYGGEEFLLLIRDLDIYIAKSVGERIRKQLEKQRIYIGSEGDRKRVTVSCGIAQYPKHAPNIKDAIECADRALYHAKEYGKNMVVLYDEISASD